MKGFPSLKRIANGINFEKLSKLSKIVISICKFSLWLMLFVVVASLFWSWTFGGGDVLTITQFADLTGDKGGKLGSVVTATLRYEINNIIRTPGLKQNFLWRSGTIEHKTSPEKIGSTSYKSIGRIGLGGFQLPVGQVLQAIEDLWPNIGDKSSVTGSIQKIESENGTYLYRIAANFEINDETIEQMVFEEKLGADADIFSLVKDLAFWTIWSVEKQHNNIKAMSWKSFKHFSIGVKWLSYFNSTGHPDAFKNAEKNLLTAIREDPDYVKAHYNLGLLYYWDTFYKWNKVGKSNQWKVIHEGPLLKNKDRIEKQNQEKTEEVFKEMLSISDSDEEKALAHFGLGMIYADQYLINQSKEKYFKKSIRNFEKVIELDPNFLSPNITIAYLYELKNDFNHAVKALEDAISRTAWSNKDRERLEKDLRKLRNKIKKPAVDMGATDKGAADEWADDEWADDEWGDDDWGDDDWGDDDWGDDKDGEN